MLRYKEYSGLDGEELRRLMALEGLALLQRKWRALRARARRLAVAMCLHARLGAQAALSILDEDTLLAVAYLGDG